MLFGVRPFNPTILRPRRDGAALEALAQGPGPPRKRDGAIEVKPAEQGQVYRQMLVAPPKPSANALLGGSDNSS